MINFLQINVDGGRIEQDLMMATASQREVDILIISEPYRCGLDNEGWYSDTGNKAAIMVYNPRIKVQEFGLKDNLGFWWVRLEGITVYTCYWYGLYTVEFLDRLEGSIKTQTGIVIIAGDFNTKSPAWGEIIERILKVMDMMASLDMVVCNYGDKPTFSRVYNGGLSRSHIDITFVSGRGSQTVRDWEVLYQYSGSLHKYISFSTSMTPHSEHRQLEEKRSFRKLDMTKLLSYIDSTRFEPGTEGCFAAKALNWYLKKACDSCMPKGSYRDEKKPTYWWTQEIANLREACNRARRRFKRARNRTTDTHVQLSTNFRDAKEELKKK